MKFKNKLIGSLIFGLLVISLTSTVSAEEFRYCKDENTLVIKEVRQVCTNEVCDNVTRSDYIECEYGCYEGENRCRYSPLLRYGIMGGIFFGIGLIIYKFAKW